MTTHKQRSRAPTDVPSTPRSAPHTSFTYRITRLIALIAAVAITAWTIYMIFLVATSNAAVIRTADTSRPWQAWSNASQVPTWQGTVPLTVGQTACGSQDFDGCTSIFPQVDQTTGQILPGPPATVAIGITTTTDPIDYEQGYLYHELGHVFDAEYLTNQDRAAFMAIYHLGTDPSRWWYIKHTVAYGVTVIYEPGEWFAEGYRECAMFGINQPANTLTYADYAYPGARQHRHQRQVCHLINSVGRRNGVATPVQKNYKRTYH